MHGAILADTMRTSWVPVEFFYHNRFKWEDWFASMELNYEVNRLTPKFWDGEKPGLEGLVRRPWRHFKLRIVQNNLERIANEANAFLSDDEVLQQRKDALSANVDLINERYADG